MRWAKKKQTTKAIRIATTALIRRERSSIRWSSSGARLASTLKAQRPDLPVLLTTGYASMREGDVEGLPRLAKPFRQAELISAVRAVLRR